MTSENACMSLAERESNKKAFGVDVLCDATKGLYSMGVSEDTAFIKAFREEREAAASSRMFTGAPPL